VVRWPFRRRGGEPERRDLGVGSVSWPLDSLTSSAEHAGPHNAFRLGPVFGAARILSTSVASIPLQVYRRSGFRSTRLPLPPLLQKPSSQGGVYDWLVRAVVSMVYRGNAVGLVTEFDQFERPLSIEWLNPDDVFVEDTNPVLGERGSFTNPVWYFRGVEIPSEYIVHIPWITLPGRVWGLSPMTAAASTVATGLMAREFAQGWFQAGGVPPGTFRNTTQTVDRKQSDEIKRRLVQAIRTREPIVYGADWEYTAISVSPNEARFVETMRLGASEIAAIYGVPPEMIGGETGGSYTYSSPEQREIEVVQFSLLPWLRKFEDALSALLPRGQFVKFDVDSTIRSDAATRYANYKVAREIGLMSIDEIREREDMAPLPNGQGTDPSPLIGLLPKENITALAPKDLSPKQSPPSDAPPTGDNEDG
jgi:HK97 family phage portal protein